MIDVETLSCQELVELVTDYLEGALDERDTRAFEQHLEGCGGCTEYVDQLRATIRVAGSIDLGDLSGNAADVLLQAFRDWKRSS
jgi:anti-sigma factor RsiW